jgi:hypothetical protein
MFWKQAAPEHVRRIPECGQRSPRLHGYPLRSFQRRRRGGRRFPDAWAGPEVDSVGKNVLRGFGANDKSHSKCRQTRDPQTRGQILKRPQALRLMVLTKQGCKKVHTRPATSAVQQMIPATDSHIVTWRAVHQTKRLGAGVSLGILIMHTRADGIKSIHLRNSAHSLEGYHCQPVPLAIRPAWL